jgi:hypothetical protein
MNLIKQIVFGAVIGLLVAIAFSYILVKFVMT